MKPSLWSNRLKLVFLRRQGLVEDINLVLLRKNSGVPSPAGSKIDLQSLILVVHDNANHKVSSRVQIWGGLVFGEELTPELGLLNSEYQTLPSWKWAQQHPAIEGHKAGKMER